MPFEPGAYGPIRRPWRMTSATGAGSPSIMNARPSMMTRVVRTCDTWYPLSGSGPS